MRLTVLFPLLSVVTISALTKNNEITAQRGGINERVKPTTDELRELLTPYIFNNTVCQANGNCKCVDNSILCKKDPMNIGCTCKTEGVFSGVILVSTFKTICKEFEFQIGDDSNTDRQCSRYAKELYEIAKKYVDNYTPPLKSTTAQLIEKHGLPVWASAMLICFSMVILFFAILIWWKCFNLRYLFWKLISSLTPRSAYQQASQNDPSERRLTAIDAENGNRVESRNGQSVQQPAVPNTTNPRLIQNDIPEPDSGQPSSNSDVNVNSNRVEYRNGQSVQQPAVPITTNPRPIQNDRVEPNSVQPSSNSDQPAGVTTEVIPHNVNDVQTDPHISELHEQTHPSPNGISELNMGTSNMRPDSSGQAVIAPPNERSTRNYLDNSSNRQSNEGTNQYAQQYAEVETQYTVPLMDLLKDPLSPDDREHASGATSAQSAYSKECVLPGTSSRSDTIDRVAAEIKHLPSISDMGTSNMGPDSSGQAVMAPPNERSTMNYLDNSSNRQSNEGTNQYAQQYAEVETQYTEPQMVRMNDLPAVNAEPAKPALQGTLSCAQREEAIKNLESGEEICDLVVDIGTQMMIRQHAPQKNIQSWTGHDSDLRNIISQWIDGSPDVLIAPRYRGEKANSSIGHWSLMIIERRDGNCGRVIVYDSLGMEYEQSAVLKLQQYLESQRIHNLTIEAGNSSIQRDGINCGIYVLHNIQTYLSGNPPSTPDVLKVRNELKSLFLDPHSTQQQTTNKTKVHKRRRTESTSKQSLQPPNESDPETLNDHQSAEDATGDQKSDDQTNSDQ